MSDDEGVPVNTISINKSYDICELPENDIVTRINMILENLLKDMTFCEHDSEYRMNLTPEMPAILDKLNGYLDVLQHSNTEYYMYGADQYLAKYSPRALYGGNVYIFKNFQIISKDHFIEFCKSRGLHHKEYFYENKDQSMFNRKYPLKLADVVERLQTKITYFIPYTIYFLSPDHDGTCTKFNLCRFKFIDALAIAKALE